MAHYCTACGWAYRKGLGARPRIKYRKEPKSPEKLLERLKAEYAELEVMMQEENNTRNPSAKVLYALQEKRRELGVEIRDLEHPSTVPPGRFSRFGK